MWVALHSADIGTSATPEDGGEGWVGPDDTTYRTNPRFLVAGERTMIDIWLLYRSGGFGAGVLPDAGGSFDQAAIMVEALNQMSAWADEFKTD